MARCSMPRVSSILREVDIECSKNAGIRADFVAESSGAFPSYIRRSLESSQNFLLKYLSVVLPSGCITQLIVAFLTYRETEKE